MPICIAIAVPEGIVVSTDSQITWFQNIERAIQKDSKEQFELDTPIISPVSSSRMSHEPFSVTAAGNHFAICLAGAAFINQKHTRLLFKTLEKDYQGNGNYEHVLRYYIEGIKAHLKEQFAVRNLSDASQTINVDFIMCGYDNGDIFKPRIESWCIFSGKIRLENDTHLETGELKKFSNFDSGKYSYAGCWIGRTEFISLIYNTTNQSLPPIIGQFETFSVTDALDLCKFLVEFTCDYQRFAVMVPDCGKPMIAGILTPEGYAMPLTKSGQGYY